MSHGRDPSFDQSAIHGASTAPRAASDHPVARDHVELFVSSVKGYAICMLDVEGGVSSWNAGAEECKGYRAEEVIGHDFSRFYNRADIEAGLPRRDLEQAERDGRCQLEGWRTRKDGSQFWASVVITALRDEAGGLIGFGKVTRDLSERLRTTEQLRSAIEASPTGMMMIDPQGAIVLVNAEIERLFGYARQELIGKPVEMLVPDRFRGGHGRHRAMFLAQPQTRRMGAGRDLHGLRKDGSEVPIEIGLNPLHTPDGDFVLSSVADITERRRSVEQFRLAIEAAPTGMIMIDGEGRMALVNAQVERLFGYPRDALIGERMEMLVPERFRHAHPGYREAFLRNPEFRAMGAGRDLHGLRKDGTEVPIEIGLNPLHTAEGHFILSSVVDITERKRAEQEREGLLAQLQRLNGELEERVKARTADLSATLEERGVLLQEIHHRVKNNLYVIVSLMEMQARLLEQGEGLHALQECRGRVHAIALIHEKLYQSKNYASVQFADYMRGLAHDVLQAAGTSPAQVALSLAVEDVPMTIERAIPCGLILNELLVNALKHGFPDGRSGTIRVGLCQVDRERVQLLVADDGVGLPDGLNLREGKSLGVRLVRTLAKQLDGQLTVRSEGGARFELVFPVG